MNRLPNEILEAILAYFVSDGANNDQDVDTLCAVSFTSRKLYHVAQPLLYRSIDLDIRYEKLKLLCKTLRTKAQLATTVKELSFWCRAAFVSASRQDLLRLFLHHVLPSLKGLVVLRGSNRIFTTRLIESTLYKEGNGYHMSVPTDLSNLQSLEIFAADYVYKYNYILRLPRLRRVCLNSIHVVEQNGEDAVLPNDWCWTSHSIRELVLRLVQRGPGPPGSQRLWSNSLQALSRSMPFLESLRIEQYENGLNPWLCRGLVSMFAPQLAGPLRRFELCDGNFDTVSVPLMGLLMAQVDSITAIHEIQASNLEHLTIDWSTLFHGTNNPHFSDELSNVPCPLMTLRYLNLRYAELIPGPESVIWNPETILKFVQRRFPAVEKVQLELKLHEEVNREIIQEYMALFEATEIDFEVLEHR
jgi:hypothetical protein